MGSAVGWGSAVDGYSYFLILNMIGMLPKLVITDIDGVWTDGGMYYTAEGDVMKRFSVKDGWGVIFLRELNIPVAIMTKLSGNVPIS